MQISFLSHTSGYDIGLSWVLQFLVWKKCACFLKLPHGSWFLFFLFFAFFVGGGREKGRAWLIDNDLCSSFRCLLMCQVEKQPLQKKIKGSFCESLYFCWLGGSVFWNAKETAFWNSCLSCPLRTYLYNLSPIGISDSIIKRVLKLIFSSEVYHKKRKFCSIFMDVFFRLYVLRTCPSSAVYWDLFV